MKSWLLMGLPKELKTVRKIGDALELDVDELSNAETKC